MDPQWAKFVRAYQDPFWQEVLRREAGYLRRELAGCRRVLDAGCGVGALERHLAGFSITGLDSDPAMLAEAGATGGGDYVLGDAARLCFRDAVFDAVFFVTSLEFLDDYRPAVAEAARVLTNGGKLVAMLLNPRSRHFRDRLRRGDSYYGNVRLREPTRVEEYAAGFFRVEGEYFLGIEGGRVFDSTDEDLASLYVIKGRKKFWEGV